MPRYLGKVGGVRWDVQRPPCLPTSAANVGTRGGGGGPTFVPEVQRAGGNVPRATSTLASDSDGTLHAAESEMRWVVQIGRHPSPCRCDSSHLVAPSHLPAAGCACLGGHSVRRSRGVSLVSSRLSRRDVREATLGTVTLLRSPLSEQAICGDSTRLTSRQCSKCASMRRARPAAAKTLSRAPVARLGCVVGVSETSFLRAMPPNAT